MSWQKKQVSDSRSGITDITRNSPDSFQEQCVNFVHDNKEGNLIQRAGSAYWTTFDTPATIRQIFQLEQYIFAYCYDDPAMPGDDIDGRLYWVLEDGTSVAWTEVETEGTTTEFRIRLRDEKNKGLDILVPEGDPSFLEFYKTQFTTAGQNIPAISFVGGLTPNILMAVLESRLNDAGFYIRGDNGLVYDYEDLKTNLEAVFATFTIDYSPLTDAADGVHFSGSFAPDDQSAQTGIGETTGRWTETFKPLFTKEGHVGIAEWQGHLYLSLEPFNKTFTANPDDPYAEYPDAFLPDNDREPLRKLFIVNEDTEVYPMITSAQLPIMKVGIRKASTVDLTTTDTDYRYHRTEFPILDSLGGTLLGYFVLWAERAFGPAPGNTITSLALQAVAGGPEGFTWGAGASFGQLTITLDTASSGLYGTTIGDAVARIRTQITAAIPFNTAGGTFRYFFGAIGVDDDQFFDIVQAGTTTLWTYVDPDEAVTNSVYSYGTYLRDSYVAEVEDAPRTFIFDGPASFLSELAFRPIEDNNTYVDNSSGGTRYFFARFPSIWVGLGKLFDEDYSLYVNDHLEGLVTRSVANGTEQYVSYRIKQWEPIGSVTVPTNLLYDENWERDIDYVFEYEDRVDDDGIVNAEPAYFNGGVASYDPLPQGGSYYFTVVNQTGYYANVIGNIQRVYESPPGVPHAAPGLFFEDFDDVLTGISHFSNKPIIFTPNTTWRWEGTNGPTGAGSPFIRVVSDEYGCIANQSIVRTNMGLFFWSKTGICFTDGLKAIRVTEHLIDRYSDWLSYLQTSSDEIGPRYLRGAFDEKERRVVWSALDEDGNPMAIVLDVFEGISDKMPIFIEMGNTNYYYDGSDNLITENQYQTSAIFFSEDNSGFYRGQDNRVLLSDKDTAHDEYWTGTETYLIPVRCEFKSIGFDYGDRSNRKWTKTIMWGFEDLNQKGVSLQPLGWNDFTLEAHKLYPMVNYQHVEWSADYAEVPQVTLEQFWKHTDVQWKADHIVSYKRMFPRNRIRNVYKQVGFRPLPIRVADLTPGSGNVTDIHVTFRSGYTRPRITISLFVSDDVSNAFLDSGMDSSGNFYVKWDLTDDDYIKVHRTEVNPGEITLTVYYGDIPANDYTYTGITSLTVARLFSDQIIKLNDYTMTYRVVGDRTHGLVRPESLGGFNG